MKFKCLLFCCAWVQSSFATELSVDYLLWTIKKSPVPIPFVTTASFSDDVPGALGQPGSHVKMGDKRMGMGWHNGFRIAASTWLDQEKRFGIDGSYFLLPKVTKDKTLSTSGQVGSPSYAVPIFDVTGFWGLNGNPGESIYILPGPLGSSPGFRARFQLKVSSLLQGAQLNGLFKCNQHFDALGGVRWISLQESLHFNIRSASVPGFSEPASFFNSRDRFKTTNNFIGAQAGLQARLGKKHWHLDAALKGSLGAVLERASIKGDSVSPGGNLFYLILGGVPRHISGGVFAQPTNNGTHQQARFAAAVETVLRASYRFKRYVELNAGYDFLWISRVARPGDQIDRKINPTLTGLAAVTRATDGTRTDPTPFGMPGPAQPSQGSKRPRFAFKRTDFWAQGVSLGLGIRF